MGSLHRKALSPAALVDSLASDVPNDVWIKLLVSSNRDAETWQDITWLQLKKAVDSLARWIELELGPGDGDEPIAYVGIHDARYPMVIMAALKAGYQVRLFVCRVCLR